MTAILIKLLLSLVATILNKSGLEGKIVASGLKAGEHIQTVISNLQTYQQYPNGRNGT